MSIMTMPETREDAALRTAITAMVGRYGRSCIELALASTDGDAAAQRRATLAALRQFKAVNRLASALTRGTR